MEKNCNFIVSNNFNKIYNYEEIFDKVNEEDKCNLDVEVKSVKIKNMKEKNVEIYISDEGDKDYDPYKIEFDYLQNLQKECMQKQFMDYLKTEKHGKNESKESSCCEFCCIIC